MTVEKRKKKKKEGKEKKRKFLIKGVPISNFWSIVRVALPQRPFVIVIVLKTLPKSLKSKKKGWSWIHPLETLSPSSSVGIVFSSTTVIIIIEVYGAGPTEGKKNEGAEKNAGAESTLWRVWAPPREGQIEGQLRKNILLLIMPKMGRGGAMTPLNPLFPPTLWFWLIPMWPKAQGPGPPEHMGTWGQVHNMLAD